MLYLYYVLYKSICNNNKLNIGITLFLFLFMLFQELIISHLNNCFQFNIMKKFQLGTHTKMIKKILRLVKYIYLKNLSYFL